MNSTQPIERQRYSIAHEIAHLLLHEGETTVLHPHYYKRHFDQKEIDAEAFAAELLMPRELLQESIKNLKVKEPVEEAVFLLSYLYQVSFLAMITRLHHLNLITRAVFNHLADVKPSKLEGAMNKPMRKRFFRADKFLPAIEAELKSPDKSLMYDQRGVRRLQEIAYTRYVGQETQGGANPNALYALESPGKVYENVVLWIAKKYPMDQPVSNC